MTKKRTTALTLASVVLLWLSQPPVACWPLAFVALVPLLTLVVANRDLKRSDYGCIWLVATIYWLVTLQGLRHAHPAMHACWMALAAYLAIYYCLFVWVSRRIAQRGFMIFAVAPVAWVAIECLRNYLLTGISAVMLGHTMADVPLMIQTADLWGTYGISAVLVCANVSVLVSWQFYRGEVDRKTVVTTLAASSIVLGATVSYGVFRLSQPLGEPLSTFALLQRDEEVVYEQSIEREVEMFQNYARQSIEAVAASQRPIDAVVWPESMFSAGSPWMVMDHNAKVPPSFAEFYSEVANDEELFKSSVADRQEYFRSRAGHVQTMTAQEMQNSGKTDRSPPAILAGCGVVEYDDSVGVYSGIVMVDSQGRVVDWYGKTHLVMFGEYIPIVPWFPVLRSLVPPGMGLRVGRGAMTMEIGQTQVAPNICIETAVERVTVDQMRALAAGGQMPDVIATVTNDGWFDDSSIIEHHLRCSQLVAVACRRPIVSAANNGPTASIDSNGKIVSRLPTGTNETLIATPRKDERESVYVKIGASFAWLCVGLTAVASFHRKKT